MRYEATAQKNVQAATDIVVEWTKNKWLQVVYGFLVDGMLIPILEILLTFKVQVEKIDVETVSKGNVTIRAWEQ